MGKLVTAFLLLLPLEMLWRAVWDWQDIDHVLAAVVLLLTLLLFAAVSLVGRR